MRTTIEIKPEHRAKLLALAAQKGEKGFSRLVEEALEAYLTAQEAEHEARERALRLRGSLRPAEAEEIVSSIEGIRRVWR